MIGVAVAGIYSETALFNWNNVEMVVRHPKDSFYHCNPTFHALTKNVIIETQVFGERGALLIQYHGI